MQAPGTGGAAANGALALRLRGKWTRLAQGHAPFAASCSCGAAMPAVSVADFEQLILEHVTNKFRAELDAEPALAGAVRHAAGSGLPELLTLLATQGAASDLAGKLLHELASSIDSFDDLHGAGSSFFIDGSNDS